ncbi:hypothetical protein YASMINEVIRUS_550 [Yasminevirus sp. GU-2018]|uniref:Uncharacterized protein n=1 Tax=Yasminevirus sp. GU-2018 TaxID=2420051 RepID=A0A5K0U8A2_9VIRU|nr:hypothetical protein YASMINEVIRUS_550 [Yasminevirus sp. GU-2018]
MCDLNNITFVNGISTKPRVVFIHFYLDMSVSIDNMMHRYRKVDSKFEGSMILTKTDVSCAELMSDVLFGTISKIYEASQLEAKRPDSYVINVTFMGETACYLTNYKRCSNNRDEDYFQTVHN